MLQHAMILAAGMGTRLGSITSHQPKALVKVKGIPLLGHLLQKMIRAGIREVTINIHHFPEQVLDYIQSISFPQLSIHISDERKELLDSGGGIRHASSFFPAGKDILVHNVDVLSDVDLRAMYHHHIQHHALATLAVSHRQTERYFLFDSNHGLCGWRNLKTHEEIWVEALPQNNSIMLAFSGIYILSGRFIQSLTQPGPFSIRDAFLAQAATGLIQAFSHDKDIWMDVGKPDQLAAAATFLTKLPGYDS